MLFRSSPIVMALSAVLQVPMNMSDSQAEAQTADPHSSVVISENLCGPNSLLLAARIVGVELDEAELDAMLRLGGRDVWYLGLPGIRPTADELATLCNAVLWPLPPHFSFGGGSWFHGYYQWTWYNHCLTPNHATPDCTTATSVDSAGYALYTARSMHPAGVNVLLMDGSLRFVGESIHAQTWKSLATRAGGEAVDRQF
jgi:hypothetical protein